MVGNLYVCDVCAAEAQPPPSLGNTGRRGRTVGGSETSPVPINMRVLNQVGLTETIRKSVLLRTLCTNEVLHRQLPARFRLLWDERQNHKGPALNLPIRKCSQ
jgi:hypothetical protein